MSLISLKMVKSKGMQHKSAIPCVFTLLNASFGFLSVIKALEGDCVAAAYCIVVAACLDFADGRIARAFSASSHLGMELDSLSDAISFCLAPAILLYRWSGLSQGIFFLVVLTIYVCTGLYRLARFNLHSHTDNKSYFIGLPTPISALFCATLVLQGGSLGAGLQVFILKSWLLCGLILGISGLMISGVTYPSLKYDVQQGVSVAVLILIGLLVLGLSSIVGFLLFFGATIAYICFGPIRFFLKKLLLFCN